jgi:hypothetical protein
MPQDLSAINKDIAENTVLTVFEKPFIFTHVDINDEKYNRVVIS